jgi:LysM repeat protein
LELTNTLPPLPLDAAPVTPQERTVPPTGFGQPADAAQVPPVPPGFVPPSTATEDVVGAPSDRVPPVRETTPPVRETTPPVAPAVTEHTVVRGETFYGLAQRYGVTVSDITQANPRIEASRLQVGQKLVIPAPRTDRAPSAGAGTAEGGRTYVVKRGDTLTKIAQQHGVTVSALKDLNGLVTDLIVVDQKLKLPPSGSGATGSVRN